MGTNLYSQRYSYRFEEGRHRKKRPKTFRSKDAAAQYAKRHGISKYELLNLRLTKGEKYRIVAKEK
ncbi:hypothetical protein HY491_00905 [Candidatus Woesearchaeota archaeon]|nr:hypothetical protein [Candidatus Woesearchaeota archaeon]